MESRERVAGPRPPVHRRRRVQIAAAVLAAATTVGTGVAVNLLTAGTTAGVSRLGGGQDDQSAPLTVSAQVLPQNLPCPIYIVNRAPGAISGPSRALSRNEITAARWAAEVGGVEFGSTELRLTLQGTSPSAVVVTGLRVVVQRRAAPATPGDVYQLGDGCGSGVEERFFSVDLDQPAPAVVAEEGLSNSGDVVPAVSFPFKVSETDPEVFRLEAFATHDDVDWTVAIDWISGGIAGSTELSEHEKGFSTISASPRARKWTWSDGVWTGTP